MIENDYNNDYADQDLSQDNEGAGQANLDSQDTWINDKRSQEKGMWWDPESNAPCPNRLYKSYKELEPKYTQYQQALSKYGIKDHEQLGTTLQEYQQLKDPNNEVNTVYNIMQQLFEHDVHGPELTRFIDNILEKEEIARYGSKLPPEIKDRLSKVDELEAFQKQQIEAQQQQEMIKFIETTAGEIQKFCDQYGMGYEEEKFFKYCIDNGIPPGGWYDKFVSMHLDSVLQNVQSKSANSVVSNLQKNSTAAIHTGGKKRQVNHNEINDSKSLRNAMNNIFNK